MTLFGSKEVGWVPTLVTLFGSKEVSWGPGWFFMVFHGSRLVFHGFSWFQVGFHGFSWFQVGFSWFFSKMYPLKLYPGATIQSRSAAQRTA